MRRRAAGDSVRAGLGGRAERRHHQPGRTADDAFRRKLDLLHLALGASLLIACATGLASWLLGYPFLTSSFAHPVLPIVGELPLASAAAFDLGVYLAVVGATVLALTGVGRLARTER
ncbi:MAG: MnhB domain-containing protein [Burkholderiales bacterium]